LSATAPTSRFVLLPLLHLWIEWRKDIHLFEFRVPVCFEDCATLKFGGGVESLASLDSVIGWQRFIGL
jgi:hypothetical protein